ncbi:S9 family peptidase [Ancylobacter rudongensis]|uniref:Oligopeptidase B n=1 Tax=Ancylobacter rudongensis TaxID=177413 RepID=A0A1G4TD20_9HYPH|nr:S9 family peptidase [Ancylobacter rudongensis]SCW79218.1 oligopeptidase B [Ancylobacter rudongensis]
MNTDTAARPTDAPLEPAHPPLIRSFHGQTLVDPHAWLRADNWRDVMRDPGLLAPDIRTWLEAENASAEAWLALHAALRAQLVKEMRGRIKEDDSSVPSTDGPFAYFTRFREGGQHPLICRRPAGAIAGETVLLDGDALAEGKAYFQFGDAQQSPDHRLFAWTTDEAGSEYYTLRIRDIEAGTDLPDLVAETTGDVLWSADGAHLFYIRRDAEHRPSFVYRHRLGTDPAQDVLVYEEPDKGFFVSLGRTQSRRFGLISCGDHDTSEVWLLDLESPLDAPLRVEPREPGLRYGVEHHPALSGVESLVIETNADGAEDFKIVTAPLSSPGRAHWRDLVPHKPGRLLLSATVLRDHLVRLEREDGLPRLVVRTLADGTEHEVAFAEEAYSLGFDPGHGFEKTEIRFTYSSMTTPAEVWDYDVASRARTLRKRQEVPSGHDPKRYVTRRLMAPAAGGELVPVSLLFAADTPLDGSAPCLLYGYGAYGMSMPSGFSTARLSLVDRGFVFAIAHIRGGTEKGWRWYREGKLARKTNTFSDFIAAGEHLVAEKIVAPDRIIAHGGSAGGMLMGAVANMRPGLFAGIVAEVPFVDVLNTMLDDTLPLTPPEWPEWGNPITDAQAFATIRAYSPYDNVTAQDYPAIFALAGLTDPRVTYWEPAKWVAKLRAAKTDDRPILLRTNMEAGHGGASGRFDRLEETAMIYAFALATAGR